MTTLLYLENSYNFEAEAKVSEVRTLDDGRVAVTLDKTIFYPQGGGQPCDTGSISSDVASFNVTDVRMDKDGTVLHIGKFEAGLFLQNDPVSLVIDKDRRIKNVKSHSAGHLIDCAVAVLGLLQLKPTKGYHFPKGSYVEYEGEIDNGPDMMQKLQAAIDDLVLKNGKVIVHDLSPDEAEKQGMFAPQGKKARVVSFEGFEGCGCGGTHVGHASEIGKIIIRKIKTKNGITRISYEIM